jgi:hypothetical protein
MVMVDTSVWVRFLSGRPYAAELDRLLGLDEVTGHELVYRELLIGDRGGRDRDLHGRGLGWAAPGSPPRPLARSAGNSSGLTPHPSPCATVGNS